MCHQLLPRLGAIQALAINRLEAGTGLLNLLALFDLLDRSLSPPRTVAIM